MSKVLRIPEKRLEGFIALSSMSNEAFKEFFHEIASLDLRASYEQIYQHLITSVKLTAQKEISGIIKTVQSLFSPIISSGKSVNDFVEDILVALDNQAFDSATTEELRIRLSALLKIPALSLKAKAASVYYENERTYTGSRMLSDVRPIFALEDDSIGGIVILHKLKIQYLEKDNDKEIYFALDDSDLNQLIKILQREQNKTINLKKLFADKSIDILQIENS